MPPSIAQEDLADRLNNTFVAVFEGYRGREWPNPETFTAAIYEKRGEEVDECARVEMAAEWFRARGTPHPAFNEPAITTALLKAGHFWNLREARFLGFALTESQSDEAREQRPGEAEWKHHVRVMSGLRKQSYEECEAQEFAEMTPGQTPERRMFEVGEFA